MNILEKAASSIKKYGMLRGGETVLVGLSGGPDSVCLLTVLGRLALDLRLYALYVDHGLRPAETPGEMEFCKNLCLKTGIPFAAKSIDVKSYAAGRGLNRQEAARELRYNAYHLAAAEVKADRVGLGHTLDDQVETFLMRVMRGSGPKGLACIPPVRGNIIRPLIEVERKDIEAFLRAEGIGFVTDSSNLKKDYLRNRLRVSLVPMMKAVNPNLMETLSKTIEIFREEERYFETAVTKALMKLITRKTGNAIELFLVPLTTMDRVILRRVLRRAIGETEGLRGISFLNIEDIIGLVMEGRAGDRLYLPKGTKAIKKYSTLLITSEPPVRLNTHTLEGPGDFFIKEIGMYIRSSTEEERVPDSDGKKSVVLDADKISFPLTIRGRRPGDYFYPAGFGRRKKLQDYFVDEKVPRDERDAVPIAASGEDIVWVVGLRADERFRAGEGTRRFLTLEARRA